MPHKHVLIILILILISHNSFSQGNNGLVAHWDFNGNANDISGNGLNGIVYGATLAPGYAGVANTAYHFNGTNNYIEVPYDSIMNLDSFSVCGLVKPMGFYSGTCQGNFILSRGPETSGFYYGLEMGDNAYDNSCGTYSPTHDVFYCSGTAGSGTVWYPGNSVLVTGQWYCATITFGNDTAKLYVDGLLRTSVYWPRGNTNGAAPLDIGYYRSGGPTYPYWFNGLVDDMRLYGRPLSASEAQTYCDSAKLGGIDTLTINQPFPDTLLCVNQSFSLAYTTNITFQSGNIFTAYLSDANGNFATSVAIGSTASTSSGTINCTIPQGTTYGTSYRVRVVSSSPVFTSYSDALDIHIVPIPAHSAGSNSPVCLGDTIKLTSTPTLVYGYQWTGPGTFTSTLQNPVISNASLSNVGYYYVTDSFMNGCKATDTISISVNSMPSHSASSNSPVCQGSTLNLTSSATTVNVYHWTGPNAFTSTSQNSQVLNVTSANGGAYYITDSFSNGCVGKDTVNVNINTIPTHSASSNSPICVGDTLKLFCGSSNVSSYQWTGPNSYNTSIQNPIVTGAGILNSGPYSIDYGFSNGCTATDVITVSVNATPSHSLSSNSPLCVGDSLVLTYAVGSAGIYHWTGPNGFSSTLQNPHIINITAASAGTYHVLDSFTNACRVKDSVAVTVNPKPAKPAAGSNSPLCIGDSLHLFATDVTSGVSYSWTGPGSFSSSLQNTGKANMQMPDSGKYIVTANLNGCLSIPDTVKVSVNPGGSPSVSITSVPVVITAGHSATFHANVTNCNGVVSYQWRNNGVNIVGATSNPFVFTPSSNDNISVWIHCTAPCLTTDSAVSNLISTGIAELLNNVNDFHLYPNPNTGMFTITGNIPDSKNAGIEILNSIGQLVYKTNVSIQNGVLNNDISLNKPAPGIYLIRVKTADESSVIRFVLE